MTTTIQPTSKRYGLFIGVFQAFCIVLIIYFHCHLPDPGIAMGILAVVAILMSVRGTNETSHTLERVLWIVVAAGLYWTEYRAVKFDRAEQARVSKDILKNGTDLLGKQQTLADKQDAISAKQDIISAKQDSVANKVDASYRGQTTFQKYVYAEFHASSPNSLRNRTLKLVIDIEDFMTMQNRSKPAPVTTNDRSAQARDDVEHYNQQTSAWKMNTESEFGTRFNLRISQTVAEIKQTSKNPIEFKYCGAHIEVNTGIEIFEGCEHELTNAVKDIPN